MSKLYDKITSTSTEDNCPFCNNKGFHGITYLSAKDTFTCYECGIRFFLSGESVVFFKNGYFIEIHFNNSDSGYFIWGEYFPGAQTIKYINSAVDGVLDIDPTSFKNTIARLKKLCAFS